jgi:MFS superfamily sulfate permease-like transporter
VAKTSPTQSASAFVLAGRVSRLCLADSSQIIFIEQLVPMLGLAAILSSPQASHDPPTTPIPKLLFIFEHLDHVNKTTAILSFSSLAVLIVARVIKQWLVQRPGGRWVRFVPEILIVVVGTTGE